MIVSKGRSARQDGGAQRDECPNPRPARHSAMSAPDALRVTGVRPADAGIGDGAGPAAPDGRASWAGSVCGSPDAAGPLAARGAGHWPAARGHAEATQGPGGGVTEAAPPPPAPRPPGLALAPPPPGEHTPHPCVGGGYHRPSNVAGLRVALRGAGVGESPRVGVAAVPHADDRLLQRGGPSGPGGPGSLGHAHHLPPGPRVPIHQPGVHGTPERPCPPDQEGRHRLLAGHRVGRTAVAEREIRGGLFPGV